MSLNRDPNGMPELPPEMMEAAKELGLQLVHVFCDENGPVEEGFTGVSFFAMTSFVPRVGDRIHLHDGKKVDVLRVHFDIVPFGRWQSLFPTVYAQLVEPNKEP